MVGESGSGKSVTSLTVMGLLQKGALVPSGGSVKLVGEELLTASDRRLRQLRATTMAMIFQEPMTALNPVVPVGRQIDEVLARPYRSRRARTAPEDSGDDGTGAAARGRTYLRLLSAPAVGRPAPAHHDRDGAGARTQTPDRGRADHGARRHHAKADPDADPRPATRSRHRGAVHHPRHGRGRRDCRSRRRHAQRPAGRNRHARHHPASARRWNIPATCSLRCRAWCRGRRATRAPNRWCWKPTNWARSIASAPSSARRARSRPRTA